MAEPLWRLTDAAGTEAVLQGLDSGASVAEPLSVPLIASSRTRRFILRTDLPIEGKLREALEFSRVFSKEYRSRMKRSLLLSLTAVAVAVAPVFAADLRDGYTPQHLPPKSVTDVCGDLGPTFAELRSAIDVTGAQSAAAGRNAVGLGYWSPNKQFRSVEDNYIVVNKMLEPSLDEVTDLPIALDPTSDSPAKAAALGLADAYEKSLRQVQQYAHAAVVFERAAHGRRKEQIATFGLYSGNASQNRNRNDREMTADQARAILDGESSDVKDASRQLKLPEYRWQHACPNAPIVHHQETDTMIAPADLSSPTTPAAPSAAPAAVPSPTPSASPKSR